MSDIRGEKVKFRRHEIVALHDLPSAQAHDPCIVHPGSRGTFRTAAGVFLGIAAFAVALVLLLVVAIEGGLIDRPLNARATAALNAALGSGYHAEVGNTVLRMTSGGSLALKASDVTLVENASDKRLITTRSVYIELNSLALLAGRLSVSQIEAEGAMLDPTLLPQGKPIDLTTIRISQIGDGLEGVFTQIDAISRLIARSNTQNMRIADMRLSLSGPRNKVVPIQIDTLDFSRDVDGALRIEGAFDIDGTPAQLHLAATGRPDRTMQLDGDVSGLPLAALLHRTATPAEPAFGIDSTASLTIKALRGAEGGAPTLNVSAKSEDGTFEAGGLSSSLKSSELNLSYDFGRGSIEVLPSIVRVGRSSFPFSGAVIDLDKINNDPRKGFALDLLVRAASSAPVDVSDPPLIFDAKARGQFLSETHELLFDQLKVASGQGSVAGSLSVRFGKTSPQISFAALSDELQPAAVKQLWPWWVAKTARKWVVANIFGGTVTNGRIEVFLPEGRIAENIGPLHLNDQELTIGFDIADTRVNLPGDIPPLRDAAGTFRLKGQDLDVDLKAGAAYFGSGRTVTLTGGDFAIPNTYEKPLMAEMRLDLAGNADAIAELASFRPIDALKHTPFKIEDFSGPVTAQVGARFGLVADQKPPPPQWQTQIALDGVDLKTPIAGRAITAVKGTLRIDQNQAELKSTADIDGVPMEISALEPVGAKSTVKRQRDISGTLDDKAIAKLAPGLGGILSGPVGIDIAADDTNVQKITADLDNASLVLPWVGWSKGRGIDAKVDFSTKTTDGVTEISDLTLKGDGFGASGDLVIDKSGLRKGDFTSVRLASDDDYRVAIERQKGGYGVVVNGRAADFRPLIMSMRTQDKPRTGGDAQQVSVSANLDTVSGFHSENLSNLNLRYSARGSRIDRLDLSAVTKSGQAVVAKMVANGPDNTLQLTSGDAGALARFADLYGNMRGGLLNVKLRDRGANSWRGSIDIRKFSLVNEARLQSLVSTPTGSDGRSLNQAVKRDIDVRSARFERGFANLAIDQGMVALDDGIVRGVDIGATFQGILRDKNGNMDMTGTFMPAYGLNRLFGELPLIGVLLGNGTDRGLLGITFKLTGSFEKPDLMINPLSIIAPGVFRNIFEFQ
ncbi:MULTISPECIES: DUF3971 domain-containing protein [unclassified Rhizobium]|uniref:YhdP family protein n=1 Tax=unclassified Rhizobium TaxID=2613769 RepID=UPI0006FBDFEE|nr:MULTISPECIES: DUF3971 domain-containing protein [unclassified Rhizobium]KQV34310.1 hypothetical protein ASC86_15320 [Rhizobium sp. Root1212]KRD23688.1 hypothetical protein ASE37_15310 [Rhizobium sp. Root268]